MVKSSVECSVWEAAVDEPRSPTSDSAARARTAGLHHREGKTISSILRISLAICTQDVGDKGVVIRLTPYYREQLVKRLRDYPGQQPAAVLERFVQLALDGTWQLTDREA